MRQFRLLILVCLALPACSQDEETTKLSFIKENSISSEQDMLTSIGIYQQFSFVREPAIASTGMCVLLNFDRACDFYDLAKGSFVVKPKISADLAKVLATFDGGSLNLYTASINNDTLSVGIDNDVLVFNFKKEQLLKRFSLPVDDGRFFYESQIFSVSSGNILRAYSFTAELLLEKTFPKWSLDGEIYLNDRKMFVFSDANEIKFLNLDSISISKSLTKILDLPKHLYLMGVTKDYFICANKNVNNLPAETNRLTLISRSDLSKKRFLEFDSDVLNDNKLDVNVLKSNVDGAPEPDLKPYWRIGCNGDDCLLSFQYSHKIFLYRFSLAEN
jgi:hypothetical protein